MVKYFNFLSNFINFFFQVLSIIRNGNESWKPWILSLVLEAVPVLSSLHLSTSSKEKEETNRRLALLLYYILRSPFFETSIKLNSFLKINFF